MNTNEFTHKQSRIIAIGDIHGHSLALRGLLKLIQPAIGDEFVFLGDLIDRGPDSAGVIDRAMALSKEFPTTFIMGNHEELVLAAMTCKSEFNFWLKHGGIQTLRSWRLNSSAVTYDTLLYEAPGEHLKFISKMVNYYETEKFIFVHAGYFPYCDMSKQNAGELRWMCLPDDLGPHCSGKTVICGHNRQKCILDRGHIVCIDLGCGLKKQTDWPNLLTAIDVHTNQMWTVNEHGQDGSIFLLRS